MSWLGNILANEKAPQTPVNGLELTEGERCSICDCQAEEHSIDGCPNHPRCLNFYPFQDWQYLAIEDDL